MTTRSAASNPPSRPRARGPWLAGACLLAAALWGASAGAAGVSQLSVRLVVGAQDLQAGSTVELRIYEIGGRVRRLPLTHGETWPHDSTRVIPLVLPDALDPRTVKRFALYYRSAGVSAAPWEVASAEVDLPDRGGEPHRRDCTRG
jgi:hypothetical protein